MKKIILILSLTCPISLFAGSEKWQGDSIESISHSSMFTVMIFSNSLNVKGVGLVLLSDACIKYEQEAMIAPSIKINGVSVKMYAQCIGTWQRIDFAQTDIGSNYIINEFINKNIVTYTTDGVDINFSAKGFTKAWANYKNPIDGI